MEHAPQWSLRVLLRAVAASAQPESPSEAVAEACDNNLHRTDRLENILLGVASDVLGPTRRTFGALSDGLLQRLRYIVAHGGSRGSVVRCRRRLAAKEAAFARSAKDVAEIEMVCYTAMGESCMRRVAFVASEDLEADAGADRAN